MITDAAGINLEPIWANLLAKALDGKNVKELLSNVGSEGGAPAAGIGGAAPAAEAPAEEKRRRKRRNQMRTLYVFALLCFSMPVKC